MPEQLYLSLIYSCSHAATVTHKTSYGSCLLEAYQHLIAHRDFLQRGAPAPSLATLLTYTS